MAEKLCACACFLTRRLFVYAVCAHYAEENADQQRKKARESNKNSDKGNNSGGGGKGGKSAAQKTDECRNCGEAPTLEGMSRGEVPP